MNPYLSLRSRLTLLICGLIIGVIAICVTAAYREVRRSAILGAGQRLESVAAQLGEIFATSTGRLRDRTRRLAEDPVIRSALRNPTPESLDQALATIRGSARPASSAITELWNAGGRRLLVTREVLPHGETFAPENMALLAQGDQVAVGSIQAGRDGLMFPVIAKAIEGGDLLGYLVNLLPLEESSLIRMLPRLLGEDIKVNTRLNPGLGHVLIDTGQMEQVIMNLVVNARDAMPKGGVLTIESQNIELTDEYAHRHVGVTPGDYVMLAISDTGIGMDAETVQRIFEPFFTTKKEGTGLGLATVYGIVKQSGGNIWVYSEPEHGTTFKIYLRRVDQPAEPAELSADEIKTPSGVETILLVEDEEKLKRLIRKFLESIGYKVLDATNGADARRVANEYQGAIDLLLTDVVMPETSGRDLANKLLSIRPEIKNTVYVRLHRRCHRSSWCP